MWWTVAATLAGAGEGTVDLGVTPEVGATWYAAGSGVNLRERPSVDAPVTGQLSLGQPVVVTAISEVSLTMGQRAAPWAKVGGGFVWAGALTPWRGVADLDGDGTDEVLVVAWRNDDHLVVRASAAAAPATRAAEELDLGTFGDIGGPLTQAQVRLTSGAETGIPLVQVHVPGRDMCGSGTWRRYAAWTGRALSLALSVDTWGDAPVYMLDQATFVPDAREVTLVRRHSEDGERETVTTSTRRWDGRSFALSGEPQSIVRPVASP